MRLKSLAFVWLGIAAIFRIFPLIPNFSPVMSSALFAGAKLNRKSAWVSLIVMMVATDIVLAQVHGTSIFGWWTLFTFSGVLMISLLGSQLRQKFSGGRFLACSFSGALLFWTWTNFGTWLTAGMYPMNGAGLIACFAAAIPFLKTALIGDLVWSLILFVSYELVQQRFGIASRAVGAQRA